MSVGDGTGTWPVVAALLAAAAVHVAVPGRPHARASRARGRQPPQVLAVGIVVAAAAVAVATMRGTHLAMASICGAAVLAVARMLRRSAELRAAERRREHAIAYCEALLGELKAGQPVLRALERSVEAWPETAAVAAAGRLGADVPSAFRLLGRRPGAEAVVRLAAAWELCSATGSGLAYAVEQLLETIRVHQALNRAVMGELAAARATARLVAVLPLVVLVAAQSAGARPWHFLLETPAGLACLAVGGALAFLGMTWIDRIAADAVGSGSS